MVMDRIALILVIIGALNWGSVGIFGFDIVAYICGGQLATVSRVIFTLVGLAGLWCISLLFRERGELHEGDSKKEKKNGRLFPKKSEKDVRLQISIVLCRGPGRRLHRRDSVSIPDRRTALNGRDRRAHTGRPHVLQVPDTVRLRRQDFAHQQPL